MKLAAKYGLIVGLASFAWLLGEYFLGFRTTSFDTHLVTAPFMVGLLIAGIVGAIYVSRARAGYGFKQGFATGLMVSLVAGVVMMVGQYVYLGIIDREYPNRAKAWSTYILVLDGKTLDEAKAETADGEWKRNMHVRALGQIPQFLVQGALISLVASPLLTRKKK